MNFERCGWKVLPIGTQEKQNKPRPLEYEIGAPLNGDFCHHRRIRFCKSDKKNRKEELTVGVNIKN
jgi:hypothetical protein